jgi:hypothetical protein
MEEAGHDGSWAHQRGHSAARPNGEWRPLQRDGDGGSRASRERERVGSWDGLACTWLGAKKRERKKRRLRERRCGDGKQQSFWRGMCANESAGECGGKRRRAQRRDGREGYITAPAREPHTTGRAGKQRSRTADWTRDRRSWRDRRGGDGILAKGRQASKQARKPKFKQAVMLKGFRRAWRACLQSGPRAGLFALAGCRRWALAERSAGGPAAAVGGRCSGCCRARRG